MAVGNRNFVIAAALLGTSALMVVGCGQATVEPPQEEARVPGVQMSIAQADVDACANPTSSTCTPTGAHGGPGTPAGLPAGHGAFACSVCHYRAGRLAFDPAGPAYGAGLPAPAFNATTKSCSNVACHTLPAGTYSYWFPGGDGEPEYKTVSYGGGAPQPTPSWYATGAAACTACHDDPNRSSGAWHSGYHGGQGPTGARNQCQFCHPDASSPNNGIGDTITNPSMHATGTLNVQANFSSSCFGCH